MPNADEITRVSRPDSWRREFIAAHNARCHYCNRTGLADIGPDNKPWHVDHMTPLVRGGADEESNLTLACKRCNLTKNAQPYGQFHAFAAAAFWVPDDWRASEFDLDSLMDLYQEAEDDWEPQDATWRYDQATFAIDFVNIDGDRAIIMRHEDRGCLSKAADLPRKKFATEHARMELVVRMHALIPALVAEIRMLRGAEQGPADA